MGEWFVGEIRLFTYPQGIPEGWFECKGQTLTIQQYTALYALLGTVYGGDGRTNFMLPDLRSRTIVGVNGTTFKAGQPGGTETVTLTAANMPIHNHNIQCTNVAGTLSNAANAHFATIGASTATGAPPAPAVYAPLTNVSPTPPTVHMDPRTIGDSGSGGAHENRQPSMALVYAIAWQGLFPSQQ